jgi:hypothetical protein
MFYGLGSCMPSSVAKRTDPGRHTFDTLNGPSQLGESLWSPSQFRIAVGLGPRPGASYYA